MFAVITVMVMTMPLFRKLSYFIQNSCLSKVLSHRCWVLKFEPNHASVLSKWMRMDVEKLVLSLPLFVTLLENGTNVYVYMPFNLAWKCLVFYMWSTVDPYSLCRSGYKYKHTWKTCLKRGLLVKKCMTKMYEIMFWHSISEWKEEYHFTQSLTWYL